MPEVVAAVGIAVSISVSWLIGGRVAFLFIPLIFLPIGFGAAGPIDS